MFDSRDEWDWTQVRKYPHTTSTTTTTTTVNSTNNEKKLVKQNFIPEVEEDSWRIRRWWEVCEEEKGGVGDWEGEGDRS